MRLYEPPEALVPPHVPFSSVEQADLFYPHILRIGQAVGAKLIVMEVDDKDQAERVREIARKSYSDTVQAFQLETWYDDGSVQVYDSDSDRSPIEHTEEGARAVVIWAGDWERRRAHAQQTAG